MLTSPSRREERRWSRPTCSARIINNRKECWYRNLPRSRMLDGGSVLGCLRRTKSWRSKRCTSVRIPERIYKSSCLITSKTREICSFTSSQIPTLVSINSSRSNTNDNYIFSSTIYLNHYKKKGTLFSISVPIIQKYIIYYPSWSYYHPSNRSPGLDYGNH